MVEKTNGAIVWRTVVTVVDVDTGEVRKRNDIGKYYYIVKKDVRTEIKGIDGTRYCRWFVRRCGEQISLF